MDNDTKMKEALYEIFLSIKESAELPNELPENNKFRFDLYFKSGIAIKLFVETIGEGESMEYLTWCQSGIYTSCEEYSATFDLGVNKAIWGMLINKFQTNDSEDVNPFFRR